MMSRIAHDRMLTAWWLTGVALFIAVDTRPARAAGGATIVRAVTNYFGKESAGEATEWMTKSGGRELTERLSAKATTEGGEATVEQVAGLARQYGPDAVRALDNAPTLRPVLGAIDELPTQQVGPALARLSAGEQGKELAEAVSRYGVGAMRAELKHPGVGVRFAKSLGDEGIAVAEKLTTEQAIAIGRHVDDIAKLPPSQRSELLAMISAQSDRFAAFVGDFVKRNPGKTLFTVSGTAIVLANKDAIFGGDKIVLDKDGNPVLMSTQGLLARAGSRAASEVGDRVVSPIVGVLVPVLAMLLAAYGSIKLFGMWRRQQRALAAEDSHSSG
ncbi:MAG: hypothetical protein ACO1RT_01355 [Planctomycetaceae bacterium]